MFEGLEKPALARGKCREGAARLRHQFLVAALGCERQHLSQQLCGAGISAEIAMRSRGDGERHRLQAAYRAFAKYASGASRRANASRGCLSCCLSEARWMAARIAVRVRERSVAIAIARSRALSLSAVRPRARSVPAMSINPSAAML